MHGLLILLPNNMHLPQTLLLQLQLSSVRLTLQVQLYLGLSKFQQLRQDRQLGSQAKNEKESKTQLLSCGYSVWASAYWITQDIIVDVM